MVCSNMANIFISLSKLISPDYTLVRHSSLTQGLIGSNNVILWNDSVSNIDESIYDKFKDILKKRGSKFYTHNDILPYPDFCIALLSTNSYNLNHISTPLIPARTYTAAWRSLHTISSIAESSVRTWISMHISGRTAVGYSSIHGLQMHNTTLSNTLPINVNVPLQLSDDSDVLNEALDSNKILTIPYSDQDSSIGILHSTSTPECQLNNMKLYHSTLNHIMIDN